MENEDIITFSSLDPSQKNALTKIVAEESGNIHIVYGPPGTGKSQLVVSLLAYLAGHGKTVLFVSQNTDALRVIERMIRKTEAEIGYPKGQEYLSLLDMSLMLYDTTQRRLKYLREHYTAINSKQLPGAKRCAAIKDVAYPLSYVNLDHAQNYDVPVERTIGFDELMAYYFKYVHYDVAPVSLKDFEDVKVHKLFDLLDKYPYAPYFADYVHPLRALFLLSTKNPDLNLSIIREQLSKLADMKDSVAGVTLKTLVDVPVLDYLNLLKAFLRISCFVDVVSLAEDSKNTSDICDFITSINKSQSSFNEQIETIRAKLAEEKSCTSFSVVGVKSSTPTVVLNNKMIDAIEKDYVQAGRDLEEMSGLINEIDSFAPSFKFSDVSSLQISLAHKLLELKSRFINDTSFQEVDDYFWRLGAEQVRTLHNDLQEYMAVTGPRRLFVKIPKSFLTLNVRNREWLENYSSNFLRDYENFVPLLGSIQKNLAYLMDLTAAKNILPLNKFGITTENFEELSYQLEKVAKLYDLLLKYGLEDCDYDAMVGGLSSGYESWRTICELMMNQENQKWIFQHGLHKFVDELNKNIEVAKVADELTKLIGESEKQLDVSFREFQKYFRDVESLNKLFALSNEILNALKNQSENFNKIVGTLDIRNDNMNIDMQSLDDLIEMISAVISRDVFSDKCCLVNVGNNLGDWLRRILSLSEYSNVREISEFSEHNAIMRGFYDALGDSNKAFLDQILSAEDVSFEKFTTSVVGAVVSEIYNRANRESRKTIDDEKKYFDTFADWLKKCKYNEYRDSLISIYSNAESALVELSRQATLSIPNASTFEKFRRNTKTIIQAFPIICATPKEVAKYLAADKAEFDYVIFDEASQLLPGQALPSIYRAKRAVIIGDPHQMPPVRNLSFGMTDVNEDEESDEDLGESILDLVRKQPQAQYHLKVHYRSRYNKLFEPSRAAIYEQEGIQPVFEAEPFNGAPIEIEDDLGEAIDESGYDVNFERICQSAMKYLKRIEDADKVNGAIFCILFARAEVLASFRRFLAEARVGVEFKELIDLYNAEKILLSTITNCQGIEGLYTIIYLHYYKVPAAMWFFKEQAGAYKRLNVAITRQREGLKLLLANPRSKWIEACENKLNNSMTGPNTRLGASLMKRLLENAGEETGVRYLERTLGMNEESFDSPLTEQLFLKLKEHYGSQIGTVLNIYSEVGWNLLIPTGEGIDANERNVGFRIDLGIYSLSKGKFVLGIEMDGAAYHVGYQKEHSDFTRQRVLEEKGWTLHRIWSTNWLNNAEREFKTLVAKIDLLLNE